MWLVCRRSKVGLGTMTRVSSTSLIILLLLLLLLHGESWCIWVQSHFTLMTVFSCWLRGCLFSNRSKFHIVIERNSATRSQIIICNGASLAISWARYVVIISSMLLV